MMINQLCDYFDALLDLIFPSNIKCIICGDELNLIDTIDICEKCFGKIDFINWDEDSSGLLLSFEHILTVAIYNDVVKKMIFDLKYYDKTHIAKTIAQLMNRKLGEYDLDFDMIAAIPLHRSKKRQRGFNEVHLICKHLNKLLNKEYKEDILARTKKTENMNRLTRLQRFENVEGAFEVIDMKLVINKRILLIDDVLTTGATANACSNALMEAGAKSVNLLTFARGYY